MMKKFGNLLFRVFLILLVLTPYVIEPMAVNAKEAETLADLRQQLKDLEAEKTKTANSKQQKQNQIQQNRNAVYKANQDITKAEEDIKTAEALIEKSTEEINVTIAETEELLKYSQIMRGNNVYLEYISGAGTMTDMIMRLQAVEQITEYNQKKLESLEST